MLQLQRGTTTELLKRVSELRLAMTPVPEKVKVALHRMASILGMKRALGQGQARVPHYPATEEIVGFLSVKGPPVLNIAGTVKQDSNLLITLTIISKDLFWPSTAEYNRHSETR